MIHIMYRKTWTIMIGLNEEDHKLVDEYSFVQSTCKGLRNVYEGALVNYE